ncbi:hypothetical protein SH584_10060 [Sphingomonas sp. LY29]|uniref:hypothetical protein n=1 Tax=unclassified Sphingomonas TaxID=196159 RepID=UPI002ADEF854|nr:MULTISPECIES: hypothetical protein [unclassified Sphingomonas]MEA1071928.1 hypothetical protein [Sphingomonas sp. LY160]WRP25385.1 hypothetical protein SH584_10060 [Sphingomonas sp. LY29]
MNRVEPNERTQRIRYGITGLAIVFLFVLLGTAISRSANEPLTRAEQQNVDNAEAAAEPNEPLAEIGAAPGSATDENEAQSSNTAR